MAARKKKKLTDFQKRARANVAANKKGFVTGPKGGAQTAKRIGRKPPRTSSGIKTVRDLIHALGGPAPPKKRIVIGGKSSKSATKSKVFGKDAKQGPPKTDVERGIEAIKRRRHGVQPSAAKPKRGEKDKR
jgi:hypothetical protein